MTTRPAAGRPSTVLPPRRYADPVGGAAVNDRAKTARGTRSAATATTLLKSACERLPVGFALFDARLPARRLEPALRRAARLSPQARQGWHTTRVLRALRRRARGVRRWPDRRGHPHAACCAEARPPRRARAGTARRAVRSDRLRASPRRRAAPHLRRRHRRAPRRAAPARERRALRLRDAARSTRVSTTGTSPTARSTTPTGSAPSCASRRRS